MTKQFLKSNSPRLFNAISLRYDLLNSVLSFGQHIRWRRCLARFLPPGKNLKVLDLATGTADVAITLVRFSAAVSEVIGIDLAENMLAIGREKVERAGLSGRIRLERADALALTFKDASFDAVTVAFGLRNMPDLARALIEARRVLKPGGYIIILEFSNPDNILVKPFHFVYLHYVLPFVGFLLTGNYQAYRYLSRTVGDFPYGERLERIIRQVGLTTAGRLTLAAGAATIYVAEKKA
jgi:demethylmenaquinone methyltransferase/2-methoxy-6-polyprenyl-1,4-benzoquinol methylase